MTTVIKVEGLSKAYKYYFTRWSRLKEWLHLSSKPHHKLEWALQKINFSVDAGESVGIIGINGSGKSTLLKLITGVSQPSVGSVVIHGRIAGLLELGMGFHPAFTGRQNVYLSAQLMGLSSAEINELMPHIEKFAEIGEYIDHPVRVYSSGMHVRLAFAVATAKRPEILIVDEALSVGDAYFQHKSFKRIREFQEQGTTLLFVSHDLAAVKALCSKVIWLEKGIVRKMGDPLTVVDAYTTAIYARSQDVVGITTENNAVEKVAPKEKNKNLGLRDCRQDFINYSNLRNDIKVFQFNNENRQWGDGRAKICGLSIQDQKGMDLSWVIGGEEVVVNIEAEAKEDLDQLISGFLVRDKFGQSLFGDNTFIRYIDAPFSAKKGTIIKTKFCFNMPPLPKGTYLLTAAIATGIQDSHTVHDWLEDGLYFESHNVSGVQGLIGVPMKEIKIDVSS